jgi:peroxiredoxin
MKEVLSLARIHGLGMPTCIPIRSEGFPGRRRAVMIRKTLEEIMHALKESREARVEIRSKQGILSTFSQSMVTRKRIFSLLMGVLIPLAVIVWFYSMAITSGGPNVGDEMPEFTLPILSGGRISLRDLEERGLLVFLSSECQPCTEQLSCIDSLEEAMTSMQIRVIVVFNNGYEEAAALFNEYHPHRQIAYDGKQVSRKLGLPATPAFLLVKNGILIQAEYGYLNKEALLRLVSSH